MFFLSRVPAPHLGDSPSAGRTLCPAPIWAVAVGLVLAATSVPAQDLAVHGFSPIYGPEGTPVTVIGEGFAADPLDQWAFVHSFVDGLGVVLDPVAGDLNSWTGVLGPAPRPFAGALTVWKGERWELPSALVPGESGAYLVKRADWFVPIETADGPGHFTVTRASGGTIGPLFGRDAVAIDFSSVIDPTRIDLNVTIDGGRTNGSGSGTGGGGGGLTFGSKRPGNLGTTNPSRALCLEIQNIEPVSATPAAVARDVAKVLKETYGPLGLRADAQGTTVYISWKALVFNRAFAVLHWQGN